MTTPVLRAPRLTKLRVAGVHLYNDGGEIDVDLSKPVSAFVGANGIGKSTLLALANFGVTGLVPDDSIKFQSIEEFVEGTASFARKYFDGRVAEGARTTASVTVAFEFGETQFEVERGLFEGGNVRSYRALSNDNALAELSNDAESASNTTEAYQNAVVLASGLASYEQFCFWQLFMMTFDERRHLLFWDERTLQSALMIALGHSPADAVRAEKLSRTIERKDSLARNARWRATQATSKRSRLIEEASTKGRMSEDELLALREQNDRLTQNEAAMRDSFERSEVELQDASRSLAELAIAESELEARYLEQFSGTGSHRHPSDHPVIRSVLSANVCDVCGTNGVTLAAHVQNAIENGDCPICATSLSDVLHAQTDESELVRLDQELAMARRAVGASRMRVQRVRDESTEYAQSWRQASDELHEFLKINTNNLPAASDRAVEDEIKRYDREIVEAMRETTENRRLRDETREQLEPIIVGLATAYSRIEMLFVPTFQRLAEQFIGRSVDVEFERRGVSLSLRFALDGETRRSATELSESQQFFLDIALRMSIVETFVADAATLLIDTPEGSLDIAYETRAGLLFDQFVRGGNSLILMNNLNSSNLLKELTARANVAEMAIFKMIDWSRLSEVQIESASLFDQVYMDLIKNLKSTGAAP